MQTAKNTIDFAISIAAKNFQLTFCQFNSTKDRKMRHGKANVPTKVFNPLVSALEMILSSPAKYL